MVLYYYIYIIHSQNLARIYNTEEEEKKLIKNYNKLNLNSSHQSGNKKMKLKN